MKWSFLTIGLAVLGLIGVAIIILFQNLTTNNENDYYLLKEVTEASMLDAIDYQTYRETGELRIKEKVFVESFTRRFAESTLFAGNTYTIKMFDIMEYPPKVTVLIDTGLGSYTIYNDTSDYNVVNSLSAILEYNNSAFSNIGENSIFYERNVNEYSNTYSGYIQKDYEKEYYSFIGIEGDTKINFSQALKTPDVLDVRGGLVNILSVDVVDGPTIIKENLTENVLLALLNRQLDWVAGETSYFSSKYYDDNNYYFGEIKNVKLNDIKLCNKSNSSKCNGINTYLFNWRADLDNNHQKNILFAKYKIKWKYEIFK